MPSPVLLAAPCCPSCQNLTNQRKPETIANVNKHVKQAVFSRESRIIAFGFEFEFELDFELDFELKFELESELHYYKNTKSKIFRYFLTTIKIQKAKYFVVFIIHEASKNARGNIIREKIDTF